LEADTGFSVEGVERMSENDPFVYTHWGNPTVRQLEEKLAALEGAETTAAFSSGMATATAMLLYLLKPCDHTMLCKMVYCIFEKISKSTTARQSVDSGPDRY
jgi:methionine-gamma-lyase